MVKAYERVSDLAGMGPDFRRTYVAGFKDTELTGRTGSDIMASDSSKYWHAITPESIQSVPYFTEFGSAETNNAVRAVCIEILTDMADKRIGTEEAISLPLSKIRAYNSGQFVLDRLKAEGASAEGAVKPKDLNEPYIALHNHASNKTFSFNDVDVFGARVNCVGIVAIGNSGKNAFVLMKGEDYDHFGFSVLRAKIDIGHIRYKAKDSFLKELEVYGVYYTARRY